MTDATTAAGDRCPQDAAHGRMHVMPAIGRQVCGSAMHRGLAVYLSDGITPAPLREPGAPRAELARIVAPTEIGAA